MSQWPQRVLAHRDRSQLTAASRSRRDGPPAGSRDSPCFSGSATLQANSVHQAALQRVHHVDGGAVVQPVPCQKRERHGESSDCVQSVSDGMVTPDAKPPDLRKHRPGSSAAVEVAGIEPASSGTAVGLLRAQPAVNCRGRHRCRQQCRPVTNKDFLSVQLV